MGHKSNRNSLDFGEPRQNDFSFPVSLAEKLQPRTIADFIGLDGPKQIIASLLKNPRACNLLFVGPPGAGKTAMGMAFAAGLPGSLVPVGAQKCDVAMVDALSERFAHYPGTGKFWVPLIDECGDMTDKAQLQFLSKMDGTASLKPMWGGGFEIGEAPPVIKIFTCNGTGPEQIIPPRTLLPKFLSRCMVIPFEAASQSAIAEYLKRVWKREGGRAGLPAEYFYDLAKGVGVRDALMRLDVELLRNPTVKEAKAALADKARKVKELAEIESRRLQAELDAAPSPDRSEASRRAWDTIRERQKDGYYDRTAVSQ